MAANRIVLIGHGQHVETEADEILSPGHLLELTSTNKVQKHSSQTGVFEKHFAVEDALQGKAVADAYADGDIVSSHLAVSGDVVNALLAPQPDAAYAIGDQLVSNGDGTLISIAQLPTSATADNVVGICLEVLDLQATAAVDTLAAVRVL